MDSGKSGNGPENEQPLNKGTLLSLWEENNLSTKDNMTAPIESFVEKLHSIVNVCVLTLYFV